MILVAPTRRGLHTKPRSIPTEASCFPISFQVEQVARQRRTKQCPSAWPRTSERDEGFLRASDSKEGKQVAKRSALACWGRSPTSNRNARWRARTTTERKTQERRVEWDSVSDLGARARNQETKRRRSLPASSPSPILALRAPVLLRSPELPPPPPLPELRN